MLALVGGYLIYTNVFSSPDVPASRPAKSTPAAAIPAVTAVPQPNTTRRSGRREASDFRPPYRKSRPEDRPDPNTIDPTLRLDLLAKVQAVDASTGIRNLFQFTTAAAIAASLSLHPSI